MNKPLKITRIGNSAGIVLPKELLAHLNAEVGGTLSVVTTPRGIELSAAMIGGNDRIIAPLACPPHILFP